MPAALDADRGVLLTRVAADSPLARAGVREGDLVLSVDGRPVGEPVELREEIEAKSPGTTTALSVWRDGRTTEKIVMVGREEYEKRGVLRIGLFVSPTLDLWPFDDGFDVLGIVGAHWYTRPAELSSPPREWLARALPDRNLPAPVVRSTAFFVLPVGVAVQTRTLAQHR
jgi:hypothetical protein